MENVTTPESEVTTVIFRKWPNGDIIALFPEDPSDNTGKFCSSYEHIGQHGGADASGVIGDTRPAKPAEYADLKAELEAAPYNYRLRVRQKNTYEMYQARKRAAFNQSYAAIHA